MFVDTDNKRAIRERWNLPFLRMAQARLERPLAYLGLPGAYLNDLIDWNEVLGIKTCVQIVRKPKEQREEDLEIVSQMLHNILVKDIRDTQVIRSSIEDLLITGQGTDGASPTLARKDSSSGWCFEYDLFNLDFLGGVNYKAKRKAADSHGQKSPRVRAIEQLFIRQRGQSFTLLLTVNVRDTFGDEPAQFLIEHAKRTENALLAQVAQWGATLEEGMKQHQLRLWIPLWIRELAEMQNFRCRCLPSVAYVGHEKAKMMHFAFEFEFLDGRDLRVNSDQSLEGVLKLPMLSVVDGAFFYCVSPGSPCTINEPAHGPLTAGTLAELIQDTSQVSTGAH